MTSLAPPSRPAASGLRPPLAPARCARLAVRALLEELRLWPKPGLVSPRDAGSHGDMDCALMTRAVLALRHDFHRLAAAGADGADIARLRQLGRAAEARMLRATGGVNTHRGAIFHLGLLVAASADFRPQEDDSWRAAYALLHAVRDRWGKELGAALQLSATDPDPALPSHGESARRRYGAGGARQEASEGYPTLCRVALPAFRGAWHRARQLLGTDPAAVRRRALAQTLFALIATVEDTNLLHRAGPAGLDHARRAAAGFLAAGGAFTHDWESRATALHRDFCARRLSPGGSADLLAATIFVCAVAGAGREF